MVQVSLPVEGRIDDVPARNGYCVHVLDPVEDDLTFTHECEFVTGPGAGGQWRKAFVFRWLQVARQFKVSTRGMVVPAATDDKPRADVLPAG